MIGDALGINPRDIRRGLLAWHPLQEDGLVYEDASGNGLDAIGISNPWGTSMARVMGKHGYGVSLGEYPWIHIETAGLSEQQEYMCSFFFKPTMLLTSGTQDYFTVMESDDFYGDHFRDSWDYNVFATYKGWTRLNPSVVCLAGYDDTNLRLWGTPWGDWFGSQWNASTLYFPIDKALEWDIETHITLPASMLNGDTCGSILFDPNSYLNYCGFRISKGGEYHSQLIDSYLPRMSDYTTSGCTVSASTEYSTSYKAWYAFDTSLSSYWSSSSAAHPRFLTIGTNSFQYVVQGYRLYRSNSSGDSYFPRNWTFEGSMNGADWTVLHTMVNQPNPNTNTWTGWFTFTNYTAYRDYRFNITASNGTTYTTVASVEFLVKKLVFNQTDGTIYLQVRDLTYTIDSNATMEGSYLIRMKKRGDNVYFDYRHSTMPGWISSIYYADVSTWSGVNVGVQSYNPMGSAPPILVDYVRFERGVKPPGWGDPENPGRLLIAYNQVDAGGVVEERTDSRLWLHVGRDFAYGTARFKWEPDQWYLLQFGIKPNATYNSQDYCWWVNAKQERGETVGSGIGPPTVIPAGTPFSYFDPELYTTQRGYFQLDEVSHWNRWLSPEEILKMMNKVSQIAWHKTEPYRQSSQVLLTTDTTKSGSSSEITVPKDLYFQWYTEYQSPRPDQKDVIMRKISYRIQKDLGVQAFRLPPAYINILRGSSGWAAANRGCYCTTAIPPYPIASGVATDSTHYSTAAASFMFDGNAATYYRNGQNPWTTATYVKFSYPLTEPKPRTAWKGIRFRAFSNTTYWKLDFPKDVEIWGSNLDNPTITTDSHWEYLFTVTSAPPPSNNAWADWVTFPRSVMYVHYRLKWVNNYSLTNGDWISISEMDIDTSGIPAALNFDVTANVSVYTLPRDWPSTRLPIYTSWASYQEYASFLLISSIDRLHTLFTIPSYATHSPEITYINPARNERLVHPGFLDYPQPKMYIDVTSYGGTVFDERSTRIWLTRQAVSGTVYRKYDNFCFYEKDFKIDPYGMGWAAQNANNSTDFVVNKGYNSAVTVDYGLGAPPQALTQSGIDASVLALRKLGYHYDPTCSVSGTRDLCIKTTSGSWTPTVTGTNAPFAYVTMPSGVSDWEMETRVKVGYSPDYRGQYAGLMATTMDGSQYEQLLLSPSGIVCRANEGTYETSAFGTGAALGDYVWLKIKRDQSLLSHYWSLDGDSWNRIVPYRDVVNLVPILSSNPTTYPLLSADSFATGADPWKAFDTNVSGTWWQSNDADGTGGWLKVDLGEPKPAYGYKICSTTSRNNTGLCTRWWLGAYKIQASNDDFNWSSLHTVTSVDDPGPSAWIPSSGSYFRFDNPGMYRYYRLLVDSTTYKWGSYQNPQIGSFVLLGTPSGMFDVSNQNLRVGPVVVSDRMWVDVPILRSLIPPMTSNTAPAPFVASASSTWDGTNLPYKPFSAATEKRWLSSGLVLPQWLKVDMGAQYIVKRVTMDWSYSKTWRLEGSNNDSTWYPLYSMDANGDIYGANFSAGNIDITQPYRYYRFSPTLSTTIYYGLTNIKLWGYQAVPQPKYVEATTEARFDYVYLTSSGNDISNVLAGDPWELLLDGQDVCNYQESSGLMNYTKLAPNKIRLSYQPQHEFASGDNPCVRVEARDVPTFRVDYPITSGTLLYIPASDFDGQIVDSNARATASGYLTVDESSYRYKVFSDSFADGGNWVTTVTGYRYAGTGSLKFTTSGYIYTEPLPHDLSTCNWVYHTQLYPTVTSGTTALSMIPTTPGNSFFCTVSGNYMNFSQGPTWQSATLLGSSGPFTLASGSWSHLGITRNGDQVSTYVNGIKSGYSATITGALTNSSGVSLRVGGRAFAGYMDLITFDKDKTWEDSLVVPNILDEISMFHVYSYTPFSVNLDTVQDAGSPNVVPVSPLPNASGVCPASGIIFDILDDYSGVNWDETVIIIDNVTVYSGGNNMCDFYADRGTLVFEERGRKDGEWEPDFPQGASGTTIYNDGINRQLYPPGTLYENSGAWGRRFTYNVPYDTQINYFDYRMNITITGTDSTGYLSEFDLISPNTYADAYGFDFISNDNIKMGNFFLDIHESERVDIMQAMDKHIWVDLRDLNYPVTDIVEEECTLRFSDGVENLMCSGTWFTTYTGTEGTTSGIRVHRMHYDAGDYYWDGHRTMHYYVHAQNNDPMCHVYDEKEYQLLYGWHLFWLHDDRIPPFEFNKKLPVFVSIKTQDHVPSRMSRSYMLWTAPAGTADFGVELKALPLGKGNCMEVDLVAHSHYLQYSEDVEVELSCKDVDGNELLYTWTFRTEDEPQN
jgi:hypothetical protein